MEIEVYCSAKFFDKLMKHPTVIVTYAFCKASEVFAGYKTMTYATKKGSRKVFKVTNLETGEIKYAKRSVKIPANIEFCQVWEK